MSGSYLFTERPSRQIAPRVLILLAALAAPLALAQPPDYMQRIQQDYRALFASCDLNRDGVLTREEASSCVRLAPLFDSMDVNRDGKVTSAEFEQWLADIPASPNLLQRYGSTPCPVNIFILSASIARLRLGAKPIKR